MSDTDYNAEQARILGKIMDDPTLHEAFAKDPVSTLTSQGLPSAVAADLWQRISEGADVSGYQLDGRVLKLLGEHRVQGPADKTVMGPNEKTVMGPAEKTVMGPNEKTVM